MRRLIVGSALFIILALFVLGTAGLTSPVYAKSVGKKVFIFSNPVLEHYAYNTLIGLIKAEGFDVTATSSLPVDPSLLIGYNVFIHFAKPYSPGYEYDVMANRMFLPFIEAGAAYLIIPWRLWYEGNIIYYAPLISPFGVIPLPIFKEDVTSRLAVHDVMEDVRSIWASGAPLSLISSELYPLVVGNDATWGIRDPVLMVAGTFGQGRLVVSGFGKLYDDEEPMWSQHDNALLFKNIVYWLAGEVVPEHTRDIPTLVSLEDKVAALNATYYQILGEISSLQKETSALSKQISDLRTNLQNLPEFIDLKQQLTRIIKTLDDTSSTLTQLQGENIALRQQLTQLQAGMISPQMMYVAIGIAVIALIVSFLRKRKA